MKWAALALELLGALAVVIGLGLVYWPLGIVAWGIAALLFGFALDPPRSND